MTRMTGFAVAAATLLAVLPPLPTRAQEAVRRPWAEVRCERYAGGASEFLARRGTAGLGPSFLAAHAAFLASRCAARGAICPRSEAETEAANALTVIAINAGAASTFVPFRCP